MTIVLILIHILIISFILIKRKLYAEDVNKYFSIAYFLVKCCCGYIVFIIYRDYYQQGDVFSYLKESEFFYGILRNNSSEFFNALFGISPAEVNHLPSWNGNSYNSFFSDNRTVILFNVLIRFISFGEVSVHIIWMNFFSYLGLVWIYCSLKNQGLFISKYPGVAIPFLLPGVLIWGSALSKEPLMIFALGALLRSAQLFFQNQNKKNTGFLLVSILIFFFIKLYLFLLLLPGLLAWFITKKMNIWKPSFVFTAVYLVGLIEILIAGKFFTSLDLPSLLYGQQLNNLRYAIMFLANSVVNPVLFAPTALSFLQRIPEAFIFSFFHPFFSEIKQWWMFPFALEPFILLALLIYQLKINGSVKNLSSFTWICFYSGMFLLVLLGFTIPVLGTLSRLKMPAFLLLSLSVLSLSYSPEEKQENHERS